MTRGPSDAKGQAAAAPHPWSVKVIVDQIPEAGLHRAFEADPSQRAAMRDLAGLRDLSEARAEFELRHAGRNRVLVTGRVTARIGQTCVVTLDPIEVAIDEPVDLLFAPEDQVAAIAKAMEEEAETDGEVQDPPEAIVNGTIDLGNLAADALFLGIDPYPRKPDAVFEPPVIAEDPESHPFAALKALKGDSPPPKPKKPKD
ncbi:DUF177 domain-containing protein [Bradyrhizobium prioriisuperbiae]|uniref:YceD family protein n=1 Tax=Bradyrhizobium prioriisuperbiae TaxID=2854389 RepID=UPI0028EA78B7|nr:DUF177 domain-containing protein [Bradyrhizobium prioritasuperba]